MDSMDLKGGLHHHQAGIHDLIWREGQIQIFNFGVVEGGNNRELLFTWYTIPISGWGMQSIVPPPPPRAARPVMDPGWRQIYSKGDLSVFSQTY